MAQQKTPPVTDDEVAAFFADEQFRGKAVTAGDVAVWVYRHRGGWGNSDGRWYPGSGECEVASVRGTHTTVALERLAEAGLVVKATGYLAARDMAPLSLGTVARERAHYYAWAEQVRDLAVQRAAQEAEAQRLTDRAAEAQRALGDRVRAVQVRGDQFVVVVDGEQLDALLARTQPLALLAEG